MTNQDASKQYQSALQDNLKKYPWYVAAVDSYCWLPVFVLYFLEYLSLADVLALEAIFYIAVVVFEVPSGYLSDKLGRRKILIWSGVGLIVAHGLFYFGPVLVALLELSSVFLIYGVAQICLAVGTSFRSGSDTALHFDSLQGLDRSHEYGEREAVAAKISFRSSALGALIGGALASIELKYAYGASLVFAVCTLLLARSFTEPKNQTVSQHNFGQQLMACFGLLKQKNLLWLFLFAVLMTVLNHVPYEFYQPYLKLLLAGPRQVVGGANEFLKAETTPLVSGIHAAITMFLASFLAAKSIVIKDKIGTMNTLLLAALMQLGLIYLMAEFLHPVIALLLVLRSLPRALMAAPLNAAVVPRVDQHMRATFLSLQSLFGRLCFSITLFVMPLTIMFYSDADSTEAVVQSWPEMSMMLNLPLMLGAMAIVLLAMTLTRMKVD